MRLFPPQPRLTADRASSPVLTELACCLQPLGLMCVGNSPLLPLPAGHHNSRRGRARLTASLCPRQSQAIKTPFAIFCSGQIPCDLEGTLIEGTIQEKTAACIKNLQAVLEEAGSSLAKVVKVNIFLADMGDFAVSMAPSSLRLRAFRPSGSRADGDDPQEHE